MGYKNMRTLKEGDSINILVCVKSVPDLDMLISSDWEYGENIKEPNLDYVNQIMNYYDECALEIALELRDHCLLRGNEANVNVLTVGNNKSLRILKDAYAVGAEQCYFISCDYEPRNNHHIIANIIKAFAEFHGGYDIILFGAAASPYDNGQTGYEVAGLLNTPSVMDIHSIKKADEGLEVCYGDKGAERMMTLNMPFIGIVSNVGGIHLRLPTLKNKIASSKRQIDTITLDDISIKNHIETLWETMKNEIANMSAKLEKRDCQWIESESCSNIIKVLHNIITENQ